MANPKQAITSLLTEHFRYTPLTLIDDIINTVNELVYRAVTAVEEGLTNAPAESLGFADRAIAENRVAEKDEDGSALYPESRPEIEHGVHQLETLLESTVDKNFDKLEIFVLRSILSVPEELAPWIRLGHYENLDFDASTNPTTPQALYLLRRKVQENRKLNIALAAERSRNAALIARLKGLVQDKQSSQQGQQAPLSFMTSNHTAKTLDFAATREKSQAPLSTYTHSAVSQIPALRQLIETLRSKSEGLGILKTTAASEERRDYIEGQTRRRLERESVNVTTGEGLLHGRGLGPKVGADEINGIEAVAGLLETSRRNESNGGDEMEE